jgi:hypothetical protein
MLKRATARQFTFQTTGPTAERKTLSQREPGIEIFAQGILYPVNIRIAGHLSVLIIVYFWTCLPPRTSLFFAMGFIKKRTPVLIDGIDVGWHLELPS